MYSLVSGEIGEIMEDPKINICKTKYRLPLMQISPIDDALLSVQLSKPMLV